MSLTQFVQRFNCTHMFPRNVKNSQRVPNLLFCMKASMWETLQKSRKSPQHWSHSNLFHLTTWVPSFHHDIASKWDKRVTVNNNVASGQDILGFISFLEKVMIERFECNSIKVCATLRRRRSWTPGRRLHSSFLVSINHNTWEPRRHACTELIYVLAVTNGTQILFIKFAQ